jgi:beta-xylosidase
MESTSLGRPHDPVRAGVTGLALGAVLAGVLVPPAWSAPVVHRLAAIASIGRTDQANVHAVPVFHNPVIRDDSPDPDVVLSGGTYYAFTTGNLNGPIQLFISTNLAHWTQTNWPGPLLQDATWTTYGKEWAPGVIQVGEQWVMYYATEETETGAQCITMATAPTITGPYVNDQSAPLTCDAIDPSPYTTSDGSLLLTWKGDEASGRGAKIMVEQLSADGRSFLPGTSPTVVLTADQPWETTVENPDMALIGGTWFLVYSGGSYSDASYATGYAMCTGPLGPCTKPLDHPLLTSAAEVIGPGGASAFADKSGQWWLAYAAATPGPGEYGLFGIRIRSLRIDALCVADGRLETTGPTTTPQPLASVCPPGRVA